MQTDQIALQLYTVRDHTRTEMLATLQQVAALGYRAVEFAGYGNATPSEIRATLDAHGVQAISTHVGLDRLQTDPASVFTDLHTLGCTYVVVPAVSEAYRSNLAQVHSLAALLNTLGRQCRDEGLHLGYHNHATEFSPLDGTTMWAILTEETDPALVALELDVYWAQFAGVDPVSTIQRHGGRLPLLHIKDMASDDTRADLPVGDGVLPWPAIFEAGATAGTQWYIVEQDNPRDALADVERSLRNLQRMT